MAMTSLDNDGKRYKANKEINELINKLTKSLGRPQPTHLWCLFENWLIIFNNAE